MEVTSTQSNPVDNVTFDMDLHKVAENIISMSEGGKTLTMDDYDAIVSIQKGSEQEEMSQDQLAEIYKKIIQQRAGIK
jgi:hypothetical protein